MASRLCKSLFKNDIIKKTWYVNSRTISDFQSISNATANEHSELKALKKIVKNTCEEHSYFPITSADYGYGSFSYYDVERNMTKLRKLQPTNKLISRMFHTCLVTNKDTFSSDLREPLKEEQLDDISEPLKYSTSKAHDISAIESLLPKQKARPKWEATSVIISTISFLVYWGILREESDWDEQVFSPQGLYDKVPYLEENQLEAAITYTKTQGLSTEELQAKLREVRAKRLELERLSKEKQE